MSQSDDGDMKRLDKSSQNSSSESDDIFGSMIRDNNHGRTKSISLYNRGRGPPIGQQ